MSRCHSRRQQQQCNAKAVLRIISGEDLGLPIHQRSSLVIQFYSVALTRVPRPSSIDSENYPDEIRATSVGAVGGSEIVGLA
jgi:hypothetical protein